VLYPEQCDGRPAQKAVSELERVVVALTGRWECEEDDGEEDDENDPAENDDGECIRLVLDGCPANSLEMAG